MIRRVGRTTPQCPFCPRPSITVDESMNCTESNAIFVRGDLKSLNYTKNNVIKATTIVPNGDGTS